MARGWLRGPRAASLTGMTSSAQPPDQPSFDAVLRGRRTVKTYGPDPVPREIVEEILEAARWAPNHRMTEPWRFRVLGPAAFAALCEVSGEGAVKLRRAPTLIVASYVPSPLPLHAAEDMQAAACATYNVLLAAEARGLASYWRTPAILRMAAGREACGLPDGEEVLGLIHLGDHVEEQPEPPARRGIDHYVTWLD